MLTQYAFQAQVGARGSVGTATGEPLNTVGASANLGFFERPTVTYTPLKGDDFARQLLAPIPTDAMFALFQSGFPEEPLLILGLDQVNKVRNIAFGLDQESMEEFQRFRDVVRLMVELSRRQAMALQAEKDDPETRAVGLRSRR